MQSGAGARTVAAASSPLIREIAPLQFGTIVQLDMPIDPATGTTAGTAFVQFSSAQETQKALQTTNGFQLDRTHTLRVYPYSDILLAERTDPTYREPSETDFPQLAAVKHAARCVSVVPCTG